MPQQEGGTGAPVGTLEEEQGWGRASRALKRNKCSLGVEVGFDQGIIQGIILCLGSG